VSVEVNFRGVGLFTTVESKGTRVLDEYLLPDASRSDSKGLPVHFARLIVLDATGNVVSRHDLTGTTVHIADAFGGECVLQSSFDRVQNFANAMAATSRRIATKALVASTGEVMERGSGDNSAKLRIEQLLTGETESESAIELTVLQRSRSGGTEPHGRPLPDHVTSITRISGGALSAHEQAGLPWRQAHDAGRPLKDDERLQSPAAIVSWRSTSPIATISIAIEGRVTTSILLDANHPKAYLYHYDDEWASVAQLSGFDEPRPMPNVIDGDIEDQDFKWLYSMTSIDKNTDLESMKAPFIVKADLAARRGRNPGSSTGCFGAVYHE
jgi:hypothetical protein